MEKRASEIKVKTKKRGFPHVFSLMFLIATAMAILTWIVPAGMFERVTEGGMTKVVPNTYHVVDSNPQGIFDLFHAIVTAWQAVSSIIFMVFIIGGTIKIIEDTGALRSGISKIVIKWHA